MSEVDLSSFDEFDVEQHLDKKRKKYLEAALKKCNNSKTKTAKFLKVNNHQTIGNWIKKYDLTV
jgi:transcriptional regulator with PAS, ATPase and Fis domain